jgi:hypothetical protein
MHVDVPIVMLIPYPTSSLLEYGAGLQPDICRVLFYWLKVVLAFKPNLSLSAPLNTCTEENVLRA